MALDNRSDKAIHQTPFYRVSHGVLQPKTVLSSRDSACQKLAQHGRNKANKRGSSA